MNFYPTSANSGPFRAAAAPLHLSKQSQNSEILTGQLPVIPAPRFAGKGGKLIFLGLLGLAGTWFGGNSIIEKVKTENRSRTVQLPVSALKVALPPSVQKPVQPLPGISTDITTMPERIQERLIEALSKLYEPIAVFLDQDNILVAQSLEQLSPEDRKVVEKTLKQLHQQLKAKDVRFPGVLDSLPEGERKSIEETLRLMDTDLKAGKWDQVNARFEQWADETLPRYAASPAMATALKNEGLATLQKNAEREHKLEEIQAVMLLVFATVLGLGILRKIL